MNSVVINNTINVISSKLNIDIPNTDNIEDYSRYILKALNLIKNPTYIPISWIDERDDLLLRITDATEELEALKRSIVKADSFGDGMPHGQSDPTSQEKKQIRKLQLEHEIIPQLNIKLEHIDGCIKSLCTDWNASVKDTIKEFVELTPNEKHKDILKQFYIYRKTYRKIAADSYLSEETAKDYRKRGIKELTVILFNFTNNIHKM